MKKILLSIIFIVITVVGLSAAEIEAVVDRNTVRVGDSFVLEVTVNYDYKPVYPTQPQLPNSFTIVNRSSVNSIQIINGQASKSVKYTYEIIAKKTGVFKIYPGSITDNGVVKKAPPIQIKVIKASRTNNNNQDEERLFWVEAKVSNKKPYVGEQFTYYFRFYILEKAARLLAANPDFQSPDFSSFWKEELKERKYSTIINRKRYIVFEVPVALYPTKSGKIKIASALLRLQLLVPINRRRKRRIDPFFDDFFNDPFLGGNYKRISRSLATREIILDVQPLPEGKNLPVGDFNLKFSVNKTRVKAGDVITAKIDLSGTGNINDLTEPKLNLPSEISKYSTKMKSNTFRQGDKIIAEKTFEFPLVPEKQGNYEIGPVTFTYFDPKAKKIKTLKSKSYRITVEKGKVLNTTKILGNFNKEENETYSGKKLTLLRSEIRTIKGNVTKFEKYSENDYLENYVGDFIFIFLLLPFLSCLYSRGVFNFLSITETQKRRKKLEKIKSAFPLLKKGKEGIKSFHNIFQTSIASYLDLSVTDLSGSNLKKKLEDKKISPEIIQKIADILENLNFYEVVSMPTPEDIKKIEKETKEIIDYLWKTKL